MLLSSTFIDAEVGSQTIVQQNRHKITATLGLVVHAAGMFVYEPRCQKTGLRGILPGPTQTGLYSYRRWLEA